MKAYELTVVDEKSRNCLQNVRGAFDLVYGTSEEDAKNNYRLGKSLFSDNVVDEIIEIKRAPYLDDCEKLPLMKKVELLFENSNFCWTFGGDSLAYYRHLNDKEVETFEETWLEQYGDADSCEDRW